MKKLAAILLMGATVCLAAEPETLNGLPSTNDVFVIAVSPHSKELKDYFTPATLLQALPKLVPSDVLLPAGDKIFWQSGVIVLKDKTVLFWRTCGDWFIAIDRADGRSFYAMPKKGTPIKPEESVIRLAQQTAEKAGRHLSAYSVPVAQPLTNRQDWTWVVRFNGKIQTRDGDYFDVWVNDQTGKTALTPGE